MVQQPPIRVSLVRSADEPSLIAGCRAGDPDALRRLFEQERLHVHRLLYRVVGSNTHMDDLIQDTFLEVYRSLPGFRGDSSLRTWIHRCAVRVAYAYFRRKSRLPQLEPVPDLIAEAPNPEERANQREAVRRLYAALDRLDPRQRMAFTLFAIEGRPLREVAEIMESTIGTARMRSWRARRTLYKRAKNDPLLSEFLSGHSEQEEELVR